MKNNPLESNVKFLVLKPRQCSFLFVHVLVFQIKSKSSRKETLVTESTPICFALPQSGGFLFSGLNTIQGIRFAVPRYSRSLSLVSAQIFVNFTCFISFLKKLKLLNKHLCYWLVCRFLFVKCGQSSKWTGTAGGELSLTMWLGNKDEAVKKVPECTWKWGLLINLKKNIEHRCRNSPECLHQCYVKKKNWLIFHRTKWCNIGLRCRLLFPASNDL